MLQTGVQRSGRGVRPRLTFVRACEQVIPVEKAIDPWGDAILACVSGMLGPRCATLLLRNCCHW